MMNLLIVEDSRPSCQVLKSLIEYNFREMGLTVYCSARLDEALRLTRTRRMGMAIVDATLEDSDSTNTLNHLEEFGCPVMVYSASEELAPIAYAKKAVDFIWKGDLAEVQISKIARTLAKFNDSAFARVDRAAQRQLHARLSLRAPWRQNVLLVCAVVTALSIIFGGIAWGYNSISTRSGISVTTESRIAELEKEPSRRAEQDRAMLDTLREFRKSLDSLDERLRVNDTRDQKSEDDRGAMHVQIDGNRQATEARLNRIDDKLDRLLEAVGAARGGGKTR